MGWSFHITLISWQHPFHPFVPRARQLPCALSAVPAMPGDAAFRSMNHPAVWVFFFHEISVTIQKFGYHDFGKLYCTYIYIYIFIRIQKISTSQNQESGVIRTGLVAGRRNYFSIEITMFSISESTFGCSWYIVHRQWNTVQYRACVCRRA